MNNISIYLAPLLGITGCVYRSVYNNHFNGIARLFSPFIRGKKMTEKRIRKFREIMPEYNRGYTLIPQLLSGDSDDFIHMCNRLYDLGYMEVNWNLGCPYPMVTGKGRGSGLLPHPDRIRSLLEKVIGKTECRISVKMRLGLETPAEIIDIIPVLNDYPIAEVIIHPRTARQLYSGALDLKTFGRVVELSNHPLVFNGDIRSPSDVERIILQFNSIHTIMIGRGIIADPFLPERINGLDLEADATVEQRFQRFHSELVEAYSSCLSGPRHVLDKMKEVWLHMCLLFPDSRKVLKNIQKTKTIPALLSNAAQVIPSIKKTGPDRLTHEQFKNYSTW